MPRDVRFWRNVVIVSVAHIAIIIGLVRWNRAAARVSLQSIVWMSAGITDVAVKTGQEQMARMTEKRPENEKPPKTEELIEPSVTPVPSDLQLPSRTPSPTPVMTPSPKPSITPTPPKVTAKTPKPSKKKPIAASATPKPASKKKATPAEEEKKDGEDREEATRIVPANANAGNSSESGSSGSQGTSRAPEFSWYGKMLHDRFYGEWVQPKTSTAMGAKISAVARIRIEKDGRISNFAIVKPSGNVVVDESVAAVGKRVTHVDPLPAGLASTAHYEVNINFELNPEP